MKLGRVAVFGAGYVLGSRAGRERYGQILAAARRTSTRHITLAPADFSIPTGGYVRQAPDQPTASSLDGDLGDAVDLLARASRTLVTIGCAGLDRPTP